MVKGQETILLVDDEEAVRHLIFSVLQQQGYTVLQAANGIEALELVKQMENIKVSLLITDMVMPQMGGIDLASQLKSRVSNFIHFLYQQ